MRYNKIDFHSIMHERTSQVLSIFKKETVVTIQPQDFAFTAKSVK